MTHTYRDANAFRNDYVSAPRSFVFPLAVILALLFLGGRRAGGSLAEIGGLMGFMLLAVIVTQVRRSYVTCGEIRLSDDGTCELETKHRVVRLHANEIRSVRYWQDSDVDEGEGYTIRYQGGKLRVTPQMEGFRDFLTQLKALNPAIDLTGFREWPGLRTPATETRRTDVRTRIRVALFPLIVIAFLVLIAIETLAGK